jgi:hypothetical protein
MLRSSLLLFVYIFTIAHCLHFSQNVMIATCIKSSMVYTTQKVTKKEEYFFSGSKRTVHYITVCFKMLCYKLCNTSMG